MKKIKIIDCGEASNDFLPPNIKTKFSLISEKFNIFFTAEDEKGNPYLAWLSRYDGLLIEIVAKATPELILDVLYDRKTLYDVTSECVKNGPAYMIILTQTNRIVNEISCIEDEFLPMKGEYLDVEEGEFLEEKEYYENKANEKFNIIFFDVDGVLNNKEHILKTHDATSLDPESIQYLRKLVSETNSKIVLSSSWRFIKLDVLYLHGELKLDFFDLTSLDRTITRGENIRRWLKEHKKNVKNYVIIDDDNDDIKDDQHLVQTKFETGFKEKEYQKALEILSGNFKKEDDSEVIFSFKKK